MVAYLRFCGGCRHRYLVTDSYVCGGCHHHRLVTDSQHFWRVCYRRCLVTDSCFYQASLLGYRFTALLAYLSSSLLSYRCILLGGCHHHCLVTDSPHFWRVCQSSLAWLPMYTFGWLASSLLGYRFTLLKCLPVIIVAWLPIHSWLLAQHTPKQLTDHD